MGDVCEATLKLFDQSADTVVVFEKRGEELAAIAAAGVPEGVVVPAQPAFANLVVRENKPAALNDTSLRPDLQILQLPGQRQFQSELCAPIAMAGGVFGAVAIYSQRKQEWTDDQFRLAQWLAAQCSHILDTMRVQMDLKQTVEELTRSNRDLEQFAYVASHDLQEPLRMVTTYMQRFEEKYKGQLDERGEQYLKFAVEGAGRMHQLVQDLLAYSRVSRAGRGLQAVSAEKAVDAALSNLKTAIQESGARINRQALPAVQGDAAQLAQLFQNLIGNAIKFCDPGRPPEVQIGYRAQDGRYDFFVRDNGIGIAPEHSERVFQIFQRLHTREQYPGTGIGLSICRKIVERHGGKIWVESEEGKGTTFWFSLKPA